MLAHSGAVILLSQSSSSYHFSARLTPWVHFVPLSFSSADLIQKIEWLRDNDVMAQRLAENAKNFGRSYLRMEVGDSPSVISSPSLSPLLPLPPPPLLPPPPYHYHLHKHIHTSYSLYFSTITRKYCQLHLIIALSS